MKHFIDSESDLNPFENTYLCFEVCFSVNDDKLRQVDKITNEQTKKTGLADEMTNRRSEVTERQTKRQTKR
jgi:hypothetical protein